MLSFFELFIPGDFISVKDKKWSVAIEGFLGMGLLRSFTVDNKKDNAVLMGILNKHCSSGQKPMVITGKFFNRVTIYLCLVY